MDEEGIYQLWLEYFRPLNYQLQSIVDLGEKSKVIDYNDIVKYSNELSDALIQDPIMVTSTGELAIQHFLDPDQHAVINLRVKGLHKAMECRIRELRADKIGRFTQIEAEIQKVTEIRPRMLLGMFTCSSCGFKQEIEQDPFHFTEPLECPKDDGGCGKRAGSTVFKLKVHESLFIDSQKMLVSEKRDDLRGIQQPQDIDVICEDDLCRDWTPGNVVKITGELRIKQQKSGNSKTTTFIPYLYANHIDDENVDGYNVEYDKDELLTWGMENKGHIIEKLTQSFCTSISGWDRVKQVLIYQHAGGTFNVEGKERKQRADIMVTLFGDPGTAKSVLAEWSCSLVPGSVVIDMSGSNVTEASLTAIAVKDEFGDGKWSIEGGAVVKAHKKMLMCDECHLSKPGLLGALHRPMETQLVSPAKGGIMRTFRTEFAGLFVMNPKDGRFRADDAKKALVDLIDSKKFTAPWTDRIDYYAIMVDKRDPARDEEMFKHINKFKRDEIEPELSKEFIMQYFAFVRDTFHPIIPVEVEAELKEKWLEMRGNDGVFNRQLFSIYRFAEASAKINQRNVVTSYDIDIGIMLVRESLQVLTAGYGNQIDMDAQLTGASRGKRQTYYHIMELIDKRHKESNFMGANENDLITELREEGMEHPEEYLSELSNRGTIAYHYYQNAKMIRRA